jgi:hypothetical protein
MGKLTRSWSLAEGGWCFFFFLSRRWHQSDGLFSPPFAGAHARGPGRLSRWRWPPLHAMPCHGAKNFREALGTRDVRLVLSRSSAIGPSESCNFALPVRVFREMTSCTKREKPASPPRCQISERYLYDLAQNGQMGWGQGESADVSKRRGARSLLCCAMSTVAQADAAKRAPGPLAAAERM